MAGSRRGDPMLIVLFGPSCSGKSSAAERLAALLSCEFVSGKDYLRLAASEPEAWRLFADRLRTAAGGTDSLVYAVAGDSPALDVPGAYRVRFTASLDTLCARFAARGQQLPAQALRNMMQRQSAACGALAADLVIDTTAGGDPAATAALIMASLECRDNG